MSITVRPWDQKPPVQGKQDVVPEVIKYVLWQSSSGSKRAEIAESLARDIQERLDFGTEKYGHPLQTFNGRDATLDELQKLLDAANYAMQDYLQNNSTVSLRRFARIMDLAFEVKAEMVVRS